MKKRFCHECGTVAVPEATFCEECGVELRPLAPAAIAKTAAPLPAPAPARKQPAGAAPRGRSLAILGGGLAAVAVAAGGTWFFLAPKAATEGELRAATEAWIKSADIAQKERPCLRNFDYRSNTAMVNVSETRTQEWLAVLVKAGIYTQPAEVQSGNPWQPVVLRYEKGPEAQRYIVNGQLCAAGQLQVARVTFDPKAEKTLGETRLQPGSIALAWQDRASWSQESPLKEAFDSRFQEREKDVLWLRDKDSWRVANEGEVRRLQREESKASQGSAKSAGFSFGKFFSDLFSSGGSPEQTVEAFFRHVDGGQADEASQLIDTGAIPKEKIQPMLLAAKLELAQRGGIRSVESEDLGGGENTRRLRSRITYNNGENETKVLELRKVDGRWLLDLSQ